MHQPSVDNTASRPDYAEPVLFIDGRIAGETGTHAVINPATGEVIVDAPTANTAHVDAAVTSALHATERWADDLQLRSTTLSAMADVIAQERAVLARLLATETGLPLPVATDEVGAAEFFLRSRAAHVMPTDLLIDDGRQHVEVIRKPAGIVGAIVPWNAPMMIACEKIGSAFTAGNRVVLKTSPLAPLTLLHFARLLQPLLPRGVLTILNGDNAAGAALVAHPGVGMISFTGSTRAGREIMATAAPGLKRLSLELGGNDAAIVLPDVDIRRTSAKVFQGAFYRGGQVCAAIKRLYVPRTLYDGFTEALSMLAQQVVPGDPFDEATTMGPVSNLPQFERVKALIDAAKAAGGTVTAGGAAIERPGFFFAPTIMQVEDSCNPLVREEQFGPALPILPYDDVDQVIAEANATPFGLGGSIWTDDTDKGLALARRLQSGSAWVNRHGLVHPDIPFGGMKQSGIGRANGRQGLDSYAELQTVSAALPKK